MTKQIAAFSACYHASLFPPHRSGTPAVKSQLAAYTVDEGRLLPAGIAATHLAKLAGVARGSRCHGIAMTYRITKSVPSVSMGTPIKFRNSPYLAI